MNNDPTWMLYGAAGYTGSLIAQHACDIGHRPLLAGRSEPALKALAHRLDRALSGCLLYTSRCV